MKSFKVSKMCNYASMSVSCRLFQKLINWQKRNHNCWSVRSVSSWMKSLLIGISWERGPKIKNLKTLWVHRLKILMKKKHLPCKRRTDTQMSTMLIVRSFLYFAIQSMVTSGLWLSSGEIIGISLQAVWQDLPRWISVIRHKKSLKNRPDRNLISRIRTTALHLLPYAKIGLSNLFKFVLNRLSKTYRSINATQKSSCKFLKFAKIVSQTSSMSNTRSSHAFLLTLKLWTSM